MPDWREVVRQHLDGIQLAENDVAEVVEELAEHLEDTYRCNLRQGVAEQAAAQMAWRE